MTQEEKDKRLGTAVRNNSPHSVERLLKMGADPNAIHNNKNILIIACHYAYARILLMLLKAGADPNQKSIQGNIPLIYAIQHRGSSEIIKALISYGADINASDSSGNSALHYAVYTGFGDFIAILLDAGADTSIKNKQGQTAFEIFKNKRPDEQGLSALNIFKEMYPEQYGVWINRSALACENAVAGNTCREPDFDI